MFVPTQGSVPPLARFIIFCRACTSCGCEDSGGIGTDFFVSSSLEAFRIAAITASETPAFFRATRSGVSVLNCTELLLIYNGCLNPDRQRCSRNAYFRNGFRSLGARHWRYRKPAQPFGWAGVLNQLGNYYWGFVQVGVRLLLL